MEKKIIFVPIPLAARHKVSVFKPLDLSMGFSLSPFAFPLFPAPLAHWLTSKQVAEDLPVHRLKMLNSKHTTMLAQGNALV